MTLAQKFRLYPDKEQAKRLQHYANVCRLYYNLCLKQRNLARNEEKLPTLLDIFKSESKSREDGTASSRKSDEVDWEEERKKKIIHKITYQSKSDGVVCQNSQIKLLNEIEWIADVPYSCRQESVRNLNRAFINFFTRVKNDQKVPASKKNPYGYPTFHSRVRHNSISFKPGEVKIVQNSKKAGGDSYYGRLKIQKIDSEINFLQDQPIDGKIKGSTISMKNKKWYVSFTIKREVPEPMANKQKVGIDRGITISLALSNGASINYNSPGKNLDSKIKKFQRKAARQVEKSGRWKNTKLRISRLKEKQKNQRLDILHKASNDITNEFGTVVIEDLKIKNMSSSARGDAENPGKNVKTKSRLNRSILEQSWGELARQLDYKLKWKGGKLHRVKPEHTSQTCLNCGFVSSENRKKQEKFRCQKCGFTENADINAAKVILSRHSS